MRRRAAPMRRASLRRGLRAVAVALLPLLLSSCFTMGLWGFELDDETDAGGTSTFCYDEETEWSWRLFAGRLLLTPFAVGLDLLTSPLQMVSWADDDDECAPAGRSGGRGGGSPPRRGKSLLSGVRR